MLIKTFTEKDINQVKKFTDSEIGLGYYTAEELLENCLKSVGDDGSSSSFILLDEITNQVKGLRLAYPPLKWTHGKGNLLRPDLWPHPLEKSGYFQSLFISKELQGHGYGPAMSEKSIQVLKNQSALGIATHCWKESPHNSSERYLEKMGFIKIIEHPLYWEKVNYVCPLDGIPCQCTAIEMYLEL